MRLVFTKSNLPLSKLIRWVTKEDCSHFLFVFDNGLAFESNLLGTRPVFFVPDERHFVIVHELKVSCPQEIEDKIWKSVINNYADRKYDYTGFLYLGLWILISRITGLKKPVRNKWSRKGTYFCDELYDCLDGVPGLPNLKVAGSMRTPHDVWDEVSAADPKAIANPDAA